MKPSISLIAAGNTYNPCLVVLKNKGYDVSIEEGEETLLWVATSNRNTFSAYSPPELLGIVCLWESFGENWNVQEPDILGEITKS
jgi:hypothetical protein